MDTKKYPRRFQKHRDVLEALVPRASAEVNDSHRWGVCDARHFPRPKTQIEVLKVKEVFVRESAKLVQYRSSKEHEAATHDRDIYHYLVSDHIPHLVATEAMAENPL